MTGSGTSPSSDASPEVLRTLLLAREFRQLRASTGSAGEGGPVTPSRSAPDDLLAPMVAGAMGLDRGAGDLLGLSPDVPEAVLAMGMEPEQVAGKWLAREGSPHGGRPPADQWTDASDGVLGPFCPAGTGVEVMAGIALAFTMQAERRVALLQCAGGEVTTGAWHEGLNFAAVRKVPLVLLVPTPSADARGKTRLRSLLEICDGYGIRGTSLPATNPLAIREEVTHAVERARGGDGVQLLEVPPLSTETAIEWLLSRVDGGRALVSGTARTTARLWAEARASASPAPSEALHGVWTGERVSEPWYREGLTPGTPQGGPEALSRLHRPPEAE